MKRLWLLCLVLGSTQLQAVDYELMGQVGKRWSETREQLFASKESYTLATHVLIPAVPRINVLLGPSAVIDYYEANDHCEKLTCYTASHYKIGLDLGAEFPFEPVSAFFYGRMIVHSYGKHTVRGRTHLRFPKSLSTFENGQNEGELTKRSVGYNIVTGLKWSLWEELAVVLSFELAYEKHRTEDGGIIVRNDRGETLHLSSSLQSDWYTNNSSAIYMGIAYKI